MKMGSVTWELNTNEEWCFDKDIMGTKAPKQKKKVLGSSPGREGFFSLEAKHN
jgi:hypothetical protein